MTPSLVSRAFNPNACINPEKRKLILETAKKYNFTPNKMASRLSMKDVTIGILLYYQYEPYCSEMVRGINFAHENLKDYKIKLDLRVLNKQNHTLDECEGILSEFTCYDGIIVGGLNYLKNSSILEKVYEKNNRLVLLNSDSQIDKKLFSSCFDIEGSIMLASEFFSNCLFFSKRKNVVLFTGKMESETHIKAKKVFEEMAKQYNFNVIGVYDMRDSDEVLSQICNNTLKYHLDKIDGIFITSGNSIALCRFIDECGKADSIALVTFDTFPALRSYIKKGVINATVYQNIFGQSKNAFENLFYFILENRKIPKIINTYGELVMKNNISLHE